MAKYPGSTVLLQQDSLVKMQAILSLSKTWVADLREELHARGDYDTDEVKDDLKGHFHHLFVELP